MAELTVLAKNILISKGMSEKEIDRLVEVGVHGKEDFRLIGDAGTLAQLAGVPAEVAERVMAWALGEAAVAGKETTFGAIALILAAIGLYGVMAFSVAHGVTSADPAIFAASITVLFGVAALAGFLPAAPCLADRSDDGAAIRGETGLPTGRPARRWSPGRRPA